MRVLRRCLGPLALSAAAWGIIGCGSGYGAYCEDYMDCVGGNDADVEACEVLQVAAEDIAGVDGCSEQWDEYYACLDEESRCSNNDFGPGDSCNVERDRYQSCRN
jgi:hypothetical protein